MSMTIEFRKMHGLGNDFVVIDARHLPFAPTKAQATLIADRRLGVGCDQLIVLELSDQADLFMRIFNSDGSQAEACGNATRCVAGLLAAEGVAVPRIETLRGVLMVNPARDNMFTVDMGAPIFDPALIPILADTPFDLPKLLTDFDPPVSLSMGNPHCVFFADLDTVEGLALAALAGLGTQIEHHALFPARTNVHFVAKTGPQRIRQRVFERGAGITSASGSGACAGAVAAIRTGRVTGPVECVLDGGTLWLDWDGDPASPVFMTGPWAQSYVGELTLDDHG